MKRLMVKAFLLFLSAASMSAQDRDMKIVQRPIDKATERRIALVVGNGAYKESPLNNPVNDARDIAMTLRELGFEVTLQQDVTKADMKEAIRSFGKHIREGGVGLFYFAGHGVQVEGENYLIPVGVTINHEYEVEEEAVKMDFLLGQMRNAGNRLNIVILDACRNNPFARSFRSPSRGLATIKAPGGIIIEYSTQPGNVAIDGNGRNSPFTEALLKYIREPGLEIQFVFRRVREAVFNKTDRKQMPWEATSMMGDFYFNPGKEATDARELKAEIPPPETYATEVDRMAPVFTLMNQESKPVKLTDYRGKWVVLYFYPKDFTSGCTLEAQNFKRDSASYDKANAVILGVSTDTVDSHKSFCEKEGLNFKLLADTESKVSEMYGSVMEYQGKKLSARNTFLIGPDGKIAKVFMKVKPMTHSEEVLASIAELQKK